MAEDKSTSGTENPEPSKKSKGLPLVAKIAIGCFALLVVAGILLTLAGGWLVKKAGTSILQKTIENKTGVKTDLSDVENGKISYTDEKTGQKVNIGNGEIPETFPKDFPVYPGAKVQGSLAGTDNTSQSGYWLTLTTADSFSKVAEYYKTNLKTSGWSQGQTYESATSMTVTVKKGGLEGTLTVSRETSDTETSILIILGSGSGTANTSDSGASN